MTLGTQLAARSHETPHRDALICGETTLTYREFDQQATRVAQGLLARGLRKGDRVALHMTNVNELAISYFACFRAGLIAVPMNARLKSDEIQYMLQHCEARFYIAEAGLYHHVAEAVRSSCPLVRDFIVTGAHERASGTLPFGDLVACLREDSLPDVADSDVAAILYTSGTTASPKGVTHTHASLQACGRIMHQMGLRKDDCFALFTPMTHGSGLMCVLIPGVMLGMTFALIPAFTPGTVLDVIERHRCTSTGGLPVALLGVAQEQRSSPRNVETLQFCLGGGDSLAEALQTEFERAFGFRVQELIGMTEALPTCFNRRERIRTGSVGEPAEGVEVRIVDEGGKPVSKGETGEMIARHPGTMVGYWNDAEATSNAIRDGWLYTGDLAYEGDDGFFWFAGRKKEVIVRGGSKVSPQAVEAVLLAHPKILQAGVVGAPDSTWGERVVAFVRLRNNGSCEERELIEFARRSLADHKTPEQIYFLDEMPLGLTGKVSRKTLRSMIPERQPLHV